MYRCIRWSPPVSGTRNVCSAAALALTSAVAFAGPVNLLVSGDFEANLGNVASGGDTVVNAGSAWITGWSISSTSVDLIRKAYGSIDSVGIDLAGSLGPISLAAPGAIVRDQTCRWTATSNGTASVSFGSGPGYGGSTIDNVSVMAVPVPQTGSLVFAALAAMPMVSRGRSAGQV